MRSSLINIAQTETQNGTLITGASFCNSVGSKEWVKLVECVNDVLVGASVARGSSGQNKERCKLKLREITCIKACCID